MLVAALVAGGLFACSTAVFAQAGGGAPAVPGGPGGGRRGLMTSDAFIARFQKALGETNKISDALIPRVKVVLDDMIKKMTDLRADQSIARADRASKRTAITTEASDALKAILTPDQFKVVQPLIQRNRRPAGGGGAPPPAAPPQT